MAPEINVIDPGVYETGGVPHEQFAWLRANDPVHWHPDPYEGVPGFWAITRHADVVHVSRHPELFSSHARTAMFEEFADEDTLAAFGMDDPFELTGLYSGRPLTEKSVEESGSLPDRVFLYRRPILDEWSEGEEELEQLVRHVLIHEVGHHFGFSDEDMHALEDEAR